MTFVSRDFLYFFLIVFSLRWLLPERLRNGWLLAASLWFYCSWNWRFVFLLAAVALASHALALAIHRGRAALPRALAAALAVLLHLGLIASFKFNDSMIERFEILRGSSLLGFGVFHRGWVLPLGLSYYTFQSLGYVLDVYRGMKPARSLLDYSLFLSFFPHIIAGPIARARALLAQIESPRPFDWRRLDEGCHLICWGLFQKVFVADNLAADVSAVFDGLAPTSGGVALLGLYAFILQLYADFSGYSDMAVGLAKCLGFDLSLNFNLPFFAVDMQDAWKRWHISLSGWFSDFVYRPLLELPFPFFKLYTAPLITMTLMGLWHGARLTTLLMGVYYGVVIVATLFIKSRTFARSGSAQPPAGALRPWLKRLLTFHLFGLGLLLLRADSLTEAGHLLGVMLGSFSMPPGAFELARRLAFFAGPLVLAQWFCHLRSDAMALFRLHPASRVALYACLLCLILTGGKFQSDEIFYRRF